VVSVTGLGRHPRLGADFARLWAANAISNLGDGVTVVAGPLLVAVNLGRGAVLAALAAAVWADLASIPVLYTAFFLFGKGETLADGASIALLPSIVPAERLASANARLLGTYLVGNQLIAPPLGAWLLCWHPPCRSRWTPPASWSRRCWSLRCCGATLPLPRPRGGARCGPRSARAWTGCGTTPPCGCWPSVSG
jgi:hypothetical protein